MRFDRHFDRVFCINLARRPDRWAHCVGQFAKHRIRKVQRFEGFESEHPVDGCHASHRAIYSLMVYHRWSCVMIFEDDFQIEHDDFEQRFDRVSDEVPSDMGILYLGGIYSDPPIARVTPSVIRCSRMNTTHAYAITLDYARWILPQLRYGAMDALLSDFSKLGRHYILQPNLVTQRAGWSDISGQHTDYAPVMRVTEFEKMV